MILTVEQLRERLISEETDEALAVKLKAAEMLIRAYTNNSFQDRRQRYRAEVADGVLLMQKADAFLPGDTVQISEKNQNAGLYTVEAVEGTQVRLQEAVRDEPGVVITRVVYPQDVKTGVVNMLKWEKKNREKTGVASETVSRHSVTYVDLTKDNASAGYPASLMGFLKPYMCARFGKGVKK